MTNEEIREILERSLVYPDGPKFWEAEEFPISATIGTGHEFVAHDREYITSADVDHETGRRKIYAEISSYRGLCANAVHYYCRLSSEIYNMDKSGVCSLGYMGSYKIPKEFTGIDVELGRVVTEEMINSDKKRWEGYHPGYMTNAFESKSDIYNLIDFLKTNVFAEDEWQWKINDYS